MTAVSVSADNIRLDDAETTTQWGGIGGGPGGALETDFVYQATNCFARKGATAQRGIFLSDDVNSDLSGAGTYETVMFKFICTTPGLLDLLSVPGMRLEIGSGSTPAAASSNFHFYNVQGSDTYPIDKSWLVLPIDPNIVSHRDGTTGTPDLTIADFYALEYDQIGTSKASNQAMDAVDIGAGLTLIGGDGADTDGVWQDFSDADWGTTANRYGYVREVDGATDVFLIYGQMVIGTSSAAVFNDSQSTLIFPDGLFAAGFSGITVDLQNNITDVDFIDSNFFGKGTKTGEDTRPTLTVTALNGVFNTDNCIFDSFADITLTSNCTLSGGKLTSCETLTQTGATLDNVEVVGATTANGVAFINSDNPAKIKNCKFTFSDGHAIEITATGTYTFTGNKFTSYGIDGSNDAAILNNSGGLVTLNIAGGGDTPTVNNGASASTIINNSRTLQFSGLQLNTEVRIFDAGTTTERTSLGSSPNDVGAENLRTGLTKAVIDSGGTGYAVSDVLTIVGGTGTAATVTVDAVSGGVITTISITTEGEYTVNPSSPNSPTGGAGSGASLKVTFTGTAIFQYNFVSNFQIDIVILHIDFAYLRLSDITATGSDTTIPIQQQVDRVFSNP